MPDGQIVNTFSFLGDIALNGCYIELFKKGAKPFNSIWPALKDRDYIVGNLECLPKGNQGENLLKAPRLTTTLETLNYLKDIDLSIACLAQNHIYDHLEDGFQKTCNFLDQNGIQKMGAGFESAEATRPILIEENGICVGLLNYVTEDTNPGLPNDTGVKLNMFRLENAIKDIQELGQKVDHVVLILHWGGRVEGGMYPDYDQPSIARKLIDAGASLIIGHHSHTFQPYEKYKGKYIFYSLGNFCFSDFVFEGKATAMPPRRKITALVNVDFGKKTYEVNMLFYKNKLSHFSPLKSYWIKTIVRNIIFKSLMKHKVIWGIYYFNIRRIIPVIFFFSRQDISVNEKINRTLNAIKKRV